MIYVNKKHIDGEHGAGTKVFVYPSKEDSIKLNKFVVETLGITAQKMVKADQYHCTVIYSGASCAGVENKVFNIPFVGGIRDWEVFTSPLHGSCLVGVLNSPEIVQLNREIRETYGATMNYPTFIPHITVAWGFDGKIPTTLPKFSLTFDAYKVAGIDPNWSPKDL